VFCSSTNRPLNINFRTFYAFWGYFVILWLVLHKSCDEIGVSDWQSVPMFVTVLSYSRKTITFCTDASAVRWHSVIARSICRVHTANDAA
jgi:hypothetical protein